MGTISGPCQRKPLSRNTPLHLSPTRALALCQASSATLHPTALYVLLDEAGTEVNVELYQR